MTKKEIFLKNGESLIRVLASFKNEYGEEFIVYKYNSNLLEDVLLLTGDEMDWESGFQITGDSRSPMIAKLFGLSSPEKRKLVELLRGLKNGKRKQISKEGKTEEV